MAPSKEKFVALLSEALARIKKLKKQRIAEIEDELGAAIGVSRETIEKWRRRNPKHMPSLEQAETVAKRLVEMDGLRNREEFEQLLADAGHPYADQAWDRLFPKLEGPEPAEYFTGRETKLDDLVAALEAGQLVTVWGPGGVGKSVLVAEAIKRLAPRGRPPQAYPDGIFFYDFYINASADAALERIAHFFDEKPQPTFYDAAKYALSQKKALLIFDGAENADNLRRVLAIRGKCNVLIISRDKLDIRGKRIELDILPLQQSINILYYWSTKQQTSTASQVWRTIQAANDTIATEICELVGQLPLALYLAGIYLSSSNMPAIRYREVLQKMPFATLAIKARQHASVPVLLQASLAMVIEKYPQTLDVFRITGLLAYAPFPSDVIATALDIADSSIIVCLNALAHFGLMKQFSGGRFRAFHRLIYTFAQTIEPAAAERQEEIITNIAIHYGMLIEDSAELGVKAFAILDVEKEHMLAVLAHAVAQKNWEVVRDFAETIALYLQLRGQVADLINVSENCLFAARALNDRATEGNLLLRLGAGSIYYGQHPQAIVYLQGALGLFRELVDHNGEVAALSTLAAVHQMLGQGELAHTYAQAVLAIYRDVGLDDERSKAVALSMLSMGYREQGQVEQADAYRHQMFDILQDTFERLDFEVPTELGLEGLTVDIFQTLLQMRDQPELIHEQPERMIQVIQQLIDLAHGIGNLQREAFLLVSLGSLHHYLGRYEEAIQKLQNAIKLDPLIADAYDKLADVYWELRRVDEAVALYQQRIEINSQDACNAYAKLGIFARVQGNQAEAKKFFEMALTVGEETSENGGLSRARLLENRSLAYLGLEREEEAFVLLTQALSERKPWDIILLSSYDLLADMPNPPQGLARIRGLLEEYVKWEAITIQGVSLRAMSRFS